ncbi:MAG: carbon-nitrogen hydrolase family protein [Caldilineaceae bacterium]|nr:carbon-nitrogen hydrolase family protein [Caldilineaceae bacterium]
MGVRMAAVQMNSRNDKQENLRKAEALIDEAAALGADLVALPEMFNMLGAKEDTLTGKESVPGLTSDFLRRKAMEHGIIVHGGSIPVAVPGSGKVWNMTLVYDAQGELLGSYAKIHLFDIDITGQTTHNESARFDPGTEMITLESEVGPLGLTICYDIRFPELYRALTLAGARVIFQPAAFTLYTGKDHWETLIRARAIENQIYMVSPAQIGVHPPDNRCFGSAMIVDPWGTILARAPERECVVIADIDYAAQDRVRAQLPALAHRRPDVYAGRGKT